MKNITIRGYVGMGGFLELISEISVWHSQNYGKSSKKVVLKICDESAPINEPSGFYTVLTLDFKNDTDYNLFQLAGFKNLQGFLEK